MDALFEDLATTLPWLRLDLLGRLLLATLLGGLIGWDREAHGKPAGLRTNILICVGAALLSDISVRFGGLSATDLARPDPARLAAQIVSGIGFLGAGTIIQARGSVTGLTTAATLWVVAAIGIAVGAGFFVEAVGSAVLVFLVLLPLGRLERRMALSRRNRTLKVEMARGPEAIESVKALLEARGLHVHVRVIEAERDRVAVTLDLSGDMEAVAEARDALLERPDLVKLTLS
jgi:putative Mg2+ transporter-C (MgtC) family protein